MLKTCEKLDKFKSRLFSLVWGSRWKHILFQQKAVKKQANKQTKNPNEKSIWLVFWQQVQEHERISSCPVTSLIITLVWVYNLLLDENLSKKLTPVRFMSWTSMRTEERRFLLHVPLPYVSSHSQQRQCYLKEGPLLNFIFFFKLHAWVIFPKYFKVDL